MATGLVILAASCLRCPTLLVLPSSFIYLVAFFFLLLLYISINGKPFQKNSLLWVALTRYFGMNLLLFLKNKRFWFHFSVKYSSSLWELLFHLHPWFPFSLTNPVHSHSIPSLYFLIEDQLVDVGDLALQAENLSRTDKPLHLQSNREDVVRVSK